MITNSVISDLNNNTHSDNVVVEIMFTGPDGLQYICAGVLLRKSETEIRVGFNAIEDEVRDWLDINTSHIDSIREVPETDILIYE